MADPRSRPYCRSPKLRKALNTGRVTMLQSTLHAIHFKHILNFGEPQPSAPRGAENLLVRVLPIQGVAGRIQ